MRLLAALFIAPIAVALSSPSSTFDAVVEGSSCAQRSVPYNRNAQMDCEFTVGKSLRFTLVGVGGDESVFTIEKSDMDGDYYISTAANNQTHDCAIVKPGRALPNERVASYAFVSPRTARVFHTWQECRGH